MKVYKTQEEVEADIVDNLLKINDDVTFQCDISIKAHINAWDINARNINAGDINAGNINTRNIKAWDINARNINAGDINTRNINTRNIKAWNIDARNINAGNISYYALCFAYKNITCRSIKGSRENCKHFCLDGEITIKEEVETIEIGGIKYDKVEVEAKLKDIKPVL